MAHSKLQVGLLTPLKDDEQVDVFAPSVPIYEGFNIVGRCDIRAASKQVSRKHINVNASSNSTFELIVEGQNPVILRSGSQSHKLCPQSKVAFYVGDVIELLPGKHKFRLTAASNKDSPSEAVDVPVETDDSKDIEGTMLKRKRQEMEDEAFARALQAIEDEAVTDSSNRHVLSLDDSSIIGNSENKMEEYQCRVDENSDVIGPQSESSSSTFQLLRVRGLPDAANSGCVSIQDVIQGDVVVAILSNYMVDINWLLSACPLLKHIPQVVVIHGESGTSLELLKTTKPSRWLLHKPPLRLSYGTHHSKAMILIYATGVRVVVHTANLIYVDWNNKTQGLWMQDFPYKNESQSGDRSPFENDLVEYLEALEWSGCTVNFPQIDTVKVNATFLRRFDYSSASVRLVASVPGYHQGNKLNKWGHMKLRTILEEQHFGEDFVQSPLVYQFSSLGSLDEKWLSEFTCSMSAGRTFENKPLGLGKFQIVWPTVEDVRWSLEGYAAGNAIPSPLKNVEKGFLQKYWARWMADHSDRSRAMPHIKTFVRYNGQCLAWFLLTSANLSKAAWGALQKNESQIMIRSYEVLYLKGMMKW